MKNRQTIKWKGITAASFTAFLQGTEGILFLFFGLIFSKFMFQSLGFSVATLALKELVTFLLILIILSPKKIWFMFKKILSNKDTRLFFHAGVWGTTFGNLFYILAIQLAGAGYGVILSSLYPIISIFLIKTFDKRKIREKWQVWMGVIISIVGALLFVSLPAFLSENKINISVIIGMLVGGLAGFFWALEGLILNKAMNKKDNKNFSIIDCSAMRSISALIVSWVFFVPLIYVMHISQNNTLIFSDPFFVMKKILISWKGVLIIVSISVNLIILRNIHLFSIENIGPKLTAVIDTNNFLVPSFFSIFLSHIPGLIFLDNSNHFLFEPPIWWSWFLIMPILVGVTIVVYYRKTSPRFDAEKILI